MYGKNIKGTADGFLDNQLKPGNFASAAASVGYPCQVKSPQFKKRHNFEIMMWHPD